MNKFNFNLKDEIIDLISTNNYQHFIFEKCKSDNSAVAELKKSTRNVPNKDGIYFVFTHFEENRNIENHLTYEINNSLYEFIYFGKAGGLTSKGKVVEQKLLGRINNVVGGDIRRAIKWNQEMHKNYIDSFTVYYCFLEQPQIFEEQIYTYLKNEKLKYPMLNKKRGRPTKNILHISAILMFRLKNIINTYIQREGFNFTKHIRRKPVRKKFQIIRVQIV